MLYEEFTARVKEYCEALGFGKISIRHSSSCGELAESGADILSPGSVRDTAIILSCRVSYNPNWGGYCGLPQQLVREKNDDRGIEQCPAPFIAPFLRQYRYAKDHIHLTETGQGQHLITLPETLLKKDQEKHGSKLIVELDKVAEQDRDGAYAPVMVSGSMYSYKLSDTLRQTLDTQSFAWKPARSIPIGRYLGSELFSFTDIMQEVDRNSIFLPTLLPHLNQIVTHPTPHLHAAEIHLRQEFSRMISAVVADHRACFGNILCLAGLDIDMSAFRSREEHYFVPWKAYLETNGDDCGEERILEQDVLYAGLVSRNQLRCGYK